MNPNWIPAIAAVIGLIANGFVFFANKRAEARITSIELRVVAEVQEIKMWVEERFVSEKICAARMLAAVKEARGS